ncbi:MAG: hypothetical protein DRN04_03830 [Thermoprotei archaeon]|nr:MAG: hypothetical protein DRN04_03830 [Thermoprotei archaeon]
MVDVNATLGLIEYYTQLILYLLAIGLVLSIIYAIADVLTRDRVLKVVVGKRAFVFLGNEAYYGKIVTPPRSGGGFEIYFPSEKIENPVSLLAFLVENYRETKDKKFLEEAEELLKEFKKMKLIPENFTLDQVKWNPWAPPSLISKKIFPSDIKNLNAIIIFKDLLSEEELKEKWKELRSIYHPPLIKRLGRRIYNSLIFVKDKLTATLAGGISMVAYFSPEIKRSLEDITKSTIGSVSYNPLLENSIGHLLTIEVTDIDGEKKLYQGILREYSGNYIAVYDVDYRVQVEAVYKGNRIQPGYPRASIKIEGWKFDFKQHIRVKVEPKGKVDDKVKVSVTLKNIHDNFIKVEKLTVDGNEVKVDKVLEPGQEVSVEAQAASEEPSIKIDYEICLEADIVWPISKVKIIGLGDYPPSLLKDVLKMPKIRL